MCLKSLIEIHRITHKEQNSSLTLSNIKLKVECCIALLKNVGLGNSLESPTFQWKGTGQNTNTHCKLY